MTDWNKAVIKEFRENHGRVGGHFENMNLLLLHSTGAKSGQSRLTPVAFLKDGDRFVIFASKAGAPSNPAWYYNLVANPNVEVEVGTEKIQAHATVVSEPERTELYNKMAALHSGFEEYRQKTERVIPVITLSPIK